MTRSRGRWRDVVSVFVVPACFLTAPFIAFLSHNAEAAIHPWQVLRVPAVTLVPMGIALAVVWWTRRRRAAERLAVVLSVVLVAIFNYGALSDALANSGVAPPLRLASWAGVALLGGHLAYVWSRRRSALPFLSVVGIFVVAVPLLQYVSSAAPTPMSPSPIDSTDHQRFQRTPDIYYIVPDAYGRADLLEDHFGFDNSRFLDALRERGFVVVDDALAHYPLTYLSMASTLDMDYVVEPAKDALQRGRSPFYDRIRGGSALHRRLDLEGYRYVSAPPGTWSGSECSGVEDLCIEPVSRRLLGGVLGEVEWQMAHMTPVGEFIDAFLTDSFPRPFVDPPSVARTVSQADLAGPAFVQIHMLHSHPPFLFDDNCRPTSPGTHDLQTWPDAGRAAYVEGIECTNDLILSAVDLMDDDAVVVVLGDHGPAFTMDPAAPFKDWTSETLRERYSVLSAYRLPSDCGDMPEASAVNVFRVVVSCLEGTDATLLPDRWFFAGYLDQIEVREMTRPPWPR